MTQEFDTKYAHYEKAQLLARIEELEATEITNNELPEYIEELEDLLKLQAKIIPKLDKEIKELKDELSKPNQTKLI